MKKKTSLWSAFWFSLAVALVLWFALVAEVRAEDTTLTWTPPLQQTSNCTLSPIEGLAGYRIYQLIEDVADPSIVSYTVTGLKGGDYTFAATAYNAQGEESLLSGTATKTVEQLKVTDTRAYVVAKINNAFLTVVAGTVPIGTLCEESNSVNGLSIVPVSAVTWTGTVTDVMAVAQCG